MKLFLHPFHAAVVTSLLLATSLCACVNSHDGSQHDNHDDSHNLSLNLNLKLLTEPLQAKLMKTSNALAAEDAPLDDDGRARALDPQRLFGERAFEERPARPIFTLRKPAARPVFDDAAPRRHIDACGCDADVAPEHD
jgi:hypothetical protein